MKKVEETIIFNSLEEAENFFYNLGLSFVDLSEIDLEICSEIADVLFEASLRYPLLIKSIYGIGKHKEIEEQSCMIRFSDQEYHTKNIDTIPLGKEEPPGYMNLWATPFIDDKHPAHIALALNLGNCSLAILDQLALEDSLSGFHPKNCQSFKSLVWHELGHVADYLLSLGTNPKFYNIISGIKTKEDFANHISLYAITSEYVECETIAEAFAEYHMTDNPSPLIKALGEYVIAEYDAKASIKSSVFDTIKKFG